MRDFLVWLWEGMIDRLPFVVVAEWECAIKVRLGRIVGELGPGFHWRIPFLEVVQAEPCTEQAIDLAVCNITTKDGKAISLSGNITYRIVSPAKLWRSVDDFDTSLAKLAVGLLAHYASRYSWDDLQHKRGRIQPTLRKRLSQHMGEWGVEVVRVHLTDFVLTRQINLFGGLG